MTILFTLRPSGRPLVCVYPARAPSSSGACMRACLHTNSTSPSSSVRWSCLSIISSGLTSVCGVCIASSEPRFKCPRAINARASDSPLPPPPSSSSLSLSSSWPPMHSSSLSSRRVHPRVGPPFTCLPAARSSTLTAFSRARQITLYRLSATTLIYGEIERAACYAPAGAARIREQRAIFSREIS